MKKAGLPRDWDSVMPLKRMRRVSGPVSWRMLKAAVAWRVMSRFFSKQKNRHLVIWRDDLKRVGQSHNFKPSMVNEMMADNMADMILMLGGFEDSRIRRKLGKDK